MCCIVGVNAQRRTFIRCRAPDPTGQTFTIDECSRFGQVMSIYSAEVGYSANKQLYGMPPVCNERNCTLSINATVSRLCNGRRSCIIRQDLLLRPNNGALCDLQTDANFIDVKFFCVSGMCHLYILWYIGVCQSCSSFSLFKHITLYFDSNGRRSCIMIW